LLTPPKVLPGWLAKLSAALMPPGRGAGAHSGYRPDIDGLRAVAVVGVMLYHAGLGMPGGYVGVDVFFVISGFLITSLILKELRADTFSLLDFWERRARRILPALTVLVAATMAAGWFLLLPRDYSQLAKQVLSLAAFSSNVRLWLETGYFAPESGEKPLLHTWSLSLEEQFYLVIPLLLALLFRLGKASWIFPTLLVGAAASFALAIHGTHHFPSASFFLLHSRAWELAAGSILAFARPVRNSQIRAAMAWIGLAATALPFLLYPPGLRFPGLAALPPVAGAGLLIWSGMRGEATSPPAVNRLLASPPLVWVGLLSYSLYLWHWPLFAFRQYLSMGGGASRAAKIALCLVSVILAWVSWRFVETPFRSRARRPDSPRLFKLAGAAVASLCLASMLLVASGGAKSRLSPDARRIGETKALWDEPYFKNMSAADIPQNLIPIGVPGGTPRVFVWGDSHAMAIIPAVDAACKELGLSAQAAFHVLTPPVLDWVLPDEHGLGDKSPAFNAAILDHIRVVAANAKPFHLVLAAAWDNYLKGGTEDDKFLQALRLTIAEALSAGCRVHLLRQVPRFEFDVPKALALRDLLGLSTRDLNLPLAAYQRQTARHSELLRSLATLEINLIDPLPRLVDPEGHISPGGISTGALYGDKHHLTALGSLRLKPAFTALFSTP